MLTASKISSILINITIIFFLFKKIFKNINKENVVNKSKTTGEPPLMLGMSVFFAIKDAIASVGNYKIAPNLNAPATPEAILLSINDIRKHYEK